MLKLVRVDSIKKIKNKDVSYSTIRNIRFPLDFPIQLFEVYSQYYLVDGSKRLAAAKYQRIDLIQAEIHVRQNLQEALADYKILRAIYDMSLRRQDLKEILLRTANKDKTIKKLSKELRVSITSILQLLWS